MGSITTTCRSREIISARDRNERVKTGSTFYVRVKIPLLAVLPTIISLVDTHDAKRSQSQSQSQDIYVLTLLYVNGGRKTWSDKIGRFFIFKKMVGTCVAMCGVFFFFSRGWGRK